MTNDVIWVDGSLVPSGEAVVSVFSHGMQRGSTVFDVLKVVHPNGEPHALALREHVARFVQSMELMGMTPEVGLPALEQAVADTVGANPGAEVVKLAAAWTDVPLRSLPSSTVPSIYVTAINPTNAVDPGGSPATVALTVATAPKMPAAVLPPSLKVAASYTHGVRERLAAVAAGFDDVIFRTIDGDLAEGTTQSVFSVVGEDLLLPPLDSVLDGITRRVVIDLARCAGRQIDIRPIAWAELDDADELFLCSTNAPVLPIRRIDDTDYPAPGPVTATLAADMAQLLTGVHERSARWLTAL